MWHKTLLLRRIMSVLGAILQWGMKMHETRGEVCLRNPGFLRGKIRRMASCLLLTLGGTPPKKKV